MIYFKTVSNEKLKDKVRDYLIPEEEKIITSIEDQSTGGYTIFTDKRVIICDSEDCKYKPYSIFSAADLKCGSYDITISMYYKPGYISSGKESASYIFRLARCQRNAEVDEITEAMKNDDELKKALRLAYKAICSATIK